MNQHRVNRMKRTLQALSFLGAIYFLSSCGSGSGGLTDATYLVTFNSSWSSASHPDNFPASPHFSGLIGATHNEHDVYWMENELATSGIEAMAETGSKDGLTSEINNKIIIGNSDTLISEAGIAASPGSVNFSLLVKPDFPRITLVSMLAPSPDWFVGVSGVSLIENGQWLESKTVTLFVYDAGTDDGTTYTAADVDSNPKQLVQRISISPFLVGGEIKPIGEFVFVKQ